LTKQTSDEILLNKNIIRHQASYKRISELHIQWSRLNLIAVANGSIQSAHSKAESGHPCLLLRETLGHVAIKPFTTTLLDMSLYSIGAPVHEIFAKSECS